MGLIDDIERLTEIKEAILELTGEAEEILRGYPRIHARAEAYWISHIKGALEDKGSMVTMDDTINEMDALDGDDDES